MMNSNLRRSPLSTEMGKVHPKHFISSKPSYRVAQVDIVPSTFFITPTIDLHLRQCLKSICELISKENPGIPVTVSFLQGCSNRSSYDVDKNDHVEVQSFRNPLWWKCLSTFSVDENLGSPKDDCKEDMSPFGRSWQSVLKIKNAFGGLQSRRAVIDLLPMGLCPSEDQHLTEHLTPLGTKNQRHCNVCPINFRLGVPTLDSRVKSLLATPPSLTWAFAVAMEFFRFQAGDKSANNCTSNLTVETVGVLRNWMDFMLFGTLLNEDSEKYEFMNKEWLHSKFTSIVQRTPSWASSLTIVIDYSGPEVGSKEDKEITPDDQLKILDAAWRRAVTVNVTDGNAILLSATDLTELNESVAQNIVAICKKRIAQVVN